LRGSRCQLWRQTRTMTETLEPLLVIAGPTATGKTAAAIEVARRLGGELVGADSVQVYRGFDIGSAKPTTSST
jgi:tRNA A37 N6-isopentenylltransferase MiaA